MRNIVCLQVAKINLVIKNIERVFPTKQGIDFLGFVIYPDHTRVRKRNKQNFARRLHKVKSRRRRKELIASFYGLVKHADCKNLFYKLTGIKMKSFKDLNVTYKPEDGKKRFPGTVVSIRELVNLPIIVKDYEMGIKTEQGEDRCIVSIEQNGEMKKFFTNSEEMKISSNKFQVCRMVFRLKQRLRRRRSVKGEPNMYLANETSRRKCWCITLGVCKSSEK